ncbi:hypothetical protein [Streptomyces sp. NPDC001880]
MTDTTELSARWTSRLTELAARHGGDCGAGRRSGDAGPDYRTHWPKPAPDTEKEYEMHPVEPGLCVVQRPGFGLWVPVVFRTLDDGTPYIHHGGRSTPKAV